MDIEKLHLGKKSEGSDTYLPDLLQKVERSENRVNLEFGKVLPFIGYDIWNAYEFSFLNEKGFPKNYILKIIYSAESKCIVESKSLKLYLNSFNMTKFEDEGRVRGIIRRDLEKLLETKVWIKMFDVTLTNIQTSTSLPAGVSIFSLDKVVKDNAIEIEDYQYNPQLLSQDKIISEISNTLYIKTSSLRSRCRVTAQPDFGDLLLIMKGKHLPHCQSLYKYIVSFRNENHFHEEIIETIYKDLLSFGFEELLVYGQYTRRGGIDINPLRANTPEMLFKYSNIIDTNTYFERTSRQ